jgi:hypothetical protein
MADTCQGIVFLPRNFSSRKREHHEMCRRTTTVVTKRQVKFRPPQRCKISHGSIAKRSLELYQAPVRGVRFYWENNNLINRRTMRAARKIRRPVRRGILSSIMAFLRDNSLHWFDD